MDDSFIEYIKTYYTHFKWVETNIITHNAKIINERNISFKIYYNQVKQ